ncbi:MAG: hypothetical protein JW866_06765 [Ignavibacteriales bacterium]|nr:hypothetical protein [Ignavibacteriales bacterium]
MSEFLLVSLVLLGIIIFLSSLLGGLIIILSGKFFLKEKKINYFYAVLVCAIVFVVIIILWEYNESRYFPESGILGAIFINLILSFLLTLPAAKYLFKTKFLETIKLCGVWIFLFSIFFSILYFLI